MYENRKVIVTLTTIPSRLNNIAEVIFSIIKQSVKPDEIVLSLPRKSLREPMLNKDPYVISDKLAFFLKKFNITVHRIENDYGPATKLLGLLERELAKNHDKETEPLIITVDDDKIYDKDTLKVLLEGWKRHPDCVVSRKGGIINYGNINPSLQRMWKFFVMNGKDLDLLKYSEKPVAGNEIKQDLCIDVVFGTGGVLYRPSYFCKNIFGIGNKNNKLFPQKLFIYIDDVYISAFLSLKKVKKFVITFETTEFLKTQKQQVNKSRVIDRSTINRKINPLIEINKVNPAESLHSLEATHYAYKFFKLTKPEN